MFKHILVPTDGSELSRDNAQHAVSFAKTAGSQITAVYVKPRFTTEREGDLMEPSAMDHLSQGMERRSREYLGFIENLCRHSGVACNTVNPTGNHPYKAIIQIALDNDCDLIFMASHGPRGLQSLLLGSETQKVLLHSSIPVLVYRVPEAKLAHPAKG